MKSHLMDRRTTIWTSTIVLVAIALGFSIIFAARPGSSSTLKEETSLEEWPEFSMTYLTQAGSISVGDEVISDLQTRVLEYHSSMNWTDTVVESTPVETSRGTFSSVGSYRKLDGSTLYIYDAMDGSHEVREIENGRLLVPNPVLVPLSLETLLASAKTSPRQTSISASVCTNADCTNEAVSVELQDGSEYIFASGDVPIPLKAADFEVLDLQIRAASE